MKQFLLPLHLMFVMFSACGQSTSNTQQKNKPVQKTPSQKSNIANADVMKFNKHEVRDDEGTHMIASTYILPEGWTAQDKLYWEYRDPTVPIRYKGIFKSGDGTMMIQSFPDVRASWYTGPAEQTAIARLPMLLQV